ncbi:MAG: septum formation initiator family protein [Verrucomicrobiota bacterium]
MPRQVIAELDDPQTIWSTVSRFAGVGCILMLICIISVPFFPRFRDYRALNEEGRTVEAERDRLRLVLEEKEAQLRMIESDAQFIELKARDHLDLYREGEVVFRFESAK